LATVLAPRPSVFVDGCWAFLIAVLLGVVLMVEVITGIDEKTGEPIIERSPALPGFSYHNGYTLSGQDLGDKGVKISLLRENEDERAIILPPEKAREFGKWLSKTISEQRSNLPRELPGILKRLSRQRGTLLTLRQGDKAKIQQALYALKA
jgi:hypothetical protein